MKGDIVSGTKKLQKFSCLFFKKINEYTTYISGVFMTIVTHFENKSILWDRTFKESSILGPENILSTILSKVTIWTQAV